MKRIVATLTILFISSCTWVIDLTTGQTLESYIRVNEKNIRITEERDFVEGCLIDTVLNNSQEYYTIEVVHFNVPACEQSLRYYLYGVRTDGEELLLGVKENQGANYISWFLPVEFSNYVIYGGIEEPNHLVARFRDVDALQ